MRSKLLAAAAALVGALSLQLGTAFAYTGEAGYLACSGIRTITTSVRATYDHVHQYQDRWAQYFYYDNVIRWSHRTWPRVGVWQTGSSYGTYYAASSGGNCL